MRFVLAGNLTPVSKPERVSKRMDEPPTFTRVASLETVAEAPSEAKVPQLAALPSA